MNGLNVLLGMIALVAMILILIAGYVMSRGGK